MSEFLTITVSFPGQKTRTYTANIRGLKAARKASVALFSGVGGYKVRPTVEADGVDAWGALTTSLRGVFVGGPAWQRRCAERGFATFVAEAKAAKAAAPVTEAVRGDLPRAYHVTTPDQDCGIHTASTAAGAVLAHLGHIGYGPEVVNLVDGELVYAASDENWAHVLGGLERYTVRQAYADGGVGEDWLLCDETPETVARDYGLTELSDEADVQDAADRVVRLLRDEDGLVIGRDIVLNVLARGHRQMLTPLV